MIHAKNHPGFTLIELLLAMSFISMLLLGIALTILQISRTYNKGLTTKELNTVARTITDDISRDISSSEAFSLDSASYRSFDSGGRLCLGKYSYIWNYGKAIQSASKDSNFSTYSSDDKNLSAIRFVRVPDIGAAYCAGDADQPVDPANSVDLLGQTDHDFALHGFSISSSDAAYDSVTGERLYTVSFRIGTNSIDALNADATECLAPGLPGSDLDYCAVQEFTIVIRAQNAVN